MNHHALPLLLAASCALTMTAPATPATDAVCQVWQRELSFAQSVQRHDRAAFAAHVARDAVFDANAPNPTRGREAILRNWAGILAGKSVRLRWYPQQVVVARGGTLAYSSGPYLFENRGPVANTRYTAGHFATTWARDSDGVWRVVFDGGDKGRPADAAVLAAFDSGRRRACPLPAVKH